MSYQAIYRKWRPKVFEDIIGQSHITETLKNQIKNDRVSHAYLFCGTRGTGKTTAAKVLSRAINCENPKDGSPCNECDICRGILDGSIMDVVEIDAASNNGVDNIRELKEDVNFVATQTKYRVYIIDEVHMLSTGAFNALLKTLEEPPKHVIFILATTEVHKIPETILSRCQRFDFKRITPSDIIVRMKEIAAGDGIDITDEAYSMLAQLADGSMRDGLSILERIISACGNSINEQNITDILGMVENDVIFKISDAVLSNDTVTVLGCIDLLSKQGKNLNVFCDSLIKHFRDMLVCKITDNPKKLIDCTDEVIVKLRSRAEKATYEKISNAVSILTKAKADAKWVKNPKIIYELALVKLTRPELDDSNEALLDRLSAVEEKAKNGIVTTVVTEKKEEEKETPKKKPEISARLYNPIDVSNLTQDSPIVKIARNWDKTASAMVKKYNFLVGILGNRKITIDKDGILLLFGDNETVSKNLAVRYHGEMQEAFKKITGTEFIIKSVYEKDVEDVIIDYWSLPKETKEEKPKIKENDNSDPLMGVLDSFSEIVEIQEDETGEIEFTKQEEISLDSEEDTEEFLEDNELSDDESE